MAGVEIRTVYAGVAGSHIRCQSVRRRRAPSRGGEVTRADVERVLEGARAIPVDADRQILHVLPREYVVDNQDGIRDPIGMSGVRLGVKVNLVTAATSLRAERRPLRRALRPHRRRRRARAARQRRGRALARTRRRSASPSSTSAAARPTCSSTSTAASRTPASSRPAATTSPATSRPGLRTPMAEAERLKRNYGCALGRMIADDEEIEVPGVGGHAPRKVARRVLGDIIEPRVEEIFAVVRKRIEDTGLLEQLSSRRACSPAAPSLMEGMAECAEEILGHAGAPRRSRWACKGIVAAGAGPAVRDRRRPRAATARSALAEARDAARRAARTRDASTSAPRARECRAMRKRGGFWNWLRAAFWDVAEGRVSESSTHGS